MNLLRTIYTQLHKHKELLLQALLALGIFVFAIYRLPETGQPILFNDEIGYWSNCNFLLGKNWVPVTKRIGYYSYGYSLLLIPIRLLGIFWGWRWNEIYHAGIVLNALLLVLSYFFALKITKRYLPDMDKYVRTVACFVIFFYPSTIMYAHITWSESTLLTFVWIFLYIMMRVIDVPSIGNHIAFAVVAFYLYTVHQRSLGILIVSVLMVIYLHLLRRNKFRHACAYATTIYGCYLIHTMLKKHIQNINYLGMERGGIRQILGYVCNKKSILLLGLILFLLLLMYFGEKDRKRMWQVLAIIVCMAFASLVGYLIQDVAFSADGTQGRALSIEMLTALLENSTEGNRLANNDFAGQIGKIMRIFTKNGVIRLGVSIAGKWFYMASGSALIVGWSLWALFKNVIVLLWYHLKGLLGVVGRCFVTIVCGVSGGRLCSSDDTFEMSDEEWKRRLWFLGMFLVWFSTFMISAIYKEGLYKNDDLVNGRYIDFVLGFLLIYGLYCLIKDRFWLITGVVFMGMYLASAWLCDDILMKLQRTTFELAHCVLFGRVIWNYTPPVGKIEIIVKWVTRLAIAFILIIKLGTSETLRRLLDENDETESGKTESGETESDETESDETESDKPKPDGPAKVAKSEGKADKKEWKNIWVIIALLIPVLAWGYIGKEEIDKYVVVRNEKQEKPFVPFSDWVRLLGDAQTPVYYVRDFANKRYAGALQFMLPDNTVIPVEAAECPFEEEAVFIMDDDVRDATPATECCDVVCESKGYSLLVNKSGEIYKKWIRIRRLGGF